MHFLYEVMEKPNAQMTVKVGSQTALSGTLGRSFFYSNDVINAWAHVLYSVCPITDLKLNKCSHGFSDLRLMLLGVPRNDQDINLSARKV